MNIEICNLRNDKVEKPYDVRVDRASIFGNPFYMKDESMREDVCVKYQSYFLNRLNKDDIFRKEFDKLKEIYKKYGKLRLFCWCAPKKCHAEIIKFFIEYELVD